MMDTENMVDLMFSQGQGQRNFEQRLLNHMWMVRKQNNCKQDVGGGVVIKDGKISGGRVRVNVTGEDDVKE